MGSGSGSSILFPLLYKQRPHSIAPLLPSASSHISTYAHLSEDPGLTTYFFLGVMGWGDGDSQVSRRRRRRTPGIIKIWLVFIKSRKSTISNFRTDFLVKNNPRRVSRRLAQRLYPVQRPKSTGIIKIWHFFIKIQEIHYSQFQDGLFGEK